MKTLPIRRKDDQLGIETGDRSYSIAHVVRAMASTLTQEDVEEDEHDKDQVRTAQAREHANMVKDALGDIDRDVLLQSQAFAAPT